MAKIIGISQNFAPKEKKTKNPNNEKNTLNSSSNKLFKPMKTGKKVSSNELKDKVKNLMKDSVDKMVDSSNQIVSRKKKDQTFKKQKSVISPNSTPSKGISKNQKKKLKEQQSLLSEQHEETTSFIPLAKPQTDVNSRPISKKNNKQFMKKAVDCEQNVLMPEDKGNKKLMEKFGDESESNNSMSEKPTPVKKSKFQKIKNKKSEKQSDDESEENECDNSMFIDANKSTSKIKSKIKNQLNKKGNKKMVKDLSKHSNVNGSSEEDEPTLENKPKLKKKNNKEEEYIPKKKSKLQMNKKSNKKLKEESEGDQNECDDSMSVDEGVPTPKKKANNKNEATKKRHKKPLEKSADDSENSMSVEDVDNSTPKKKFKLKKDKKNKINNILVQKSTDNGDHDDNNDSFSDDEDESNSKKKSQAKGLAREYDPLKEAATIFIGNLPNDVKRREIAELLKKYSEVKAIRLRTCDGKALFSHKDRKASRYINAYVVLKDEEGVNNALALNGFSFKNHHLRVDKANRLRPQTNDNETNKRTLFVGNLKQTVNDEQLREFFSSCGEIDYVRTFPHKLLGIGFVAFKNLDSIGLALELDKTILEGRPVNLSRYSKNHNPEKKAARTVVLHNLLDSTTKEQITEKFSKFGEIEYVQLAKKNDKTVAFVCFVEAIPARKAIKSADTTINGNPIKVVQYKNDFTTAKFNKKNTFHGKKVQGFKNKKPFKGNTKMYKLAKKIAPKSL